jgi:autotransporter-associated beta strand protein
VRHFRLSLALALAAVLSLPAFAATKTWTGAGGVGNWTNPANWSGLTAPAAGDDLVFPSGPALVATTNDFAVDTAFQSITISGGGYTFGGNEIVLGAGGLTGSASSTSTWSVPVKLGASQHWSVTAPVTLDGAVNLNGMVLTLDQGAVQSGVISGNGTIVITGSWTLSGANTFTGQLQITGLLSVYSATALGATGAGNETIVNSGGTLRPAGGSYAENLILNGSGQSSGFGAMYITSGDVTFTGTVTLATNVTLNAILGITVTFAGQITGPGRLTLGTFGHFTLSNSSNNFTGGMGFNCITATFRLTVDADNAIPTSTSINVGSCAMFIHNRAQTLASIAGTGYIDLGDNGTTVLTLTSPPSTSFSGWISGSGSIVQSGGTISYGSLIYTGSYTHTGGTTNLGYLEAPFTQSAGTLALRAGATAGSVTINGGTFAPTGSSNSGNLALAAAATYVQNVDNSVVHVTGTVNLGGATLTLTGTGGVVLGNVITILDNDGTDAVTGTFAGLPPGSRITGGPGGFDYVISYTGGTGNDVVLIVTTPLPVTATFAAAPTTIALGSSTTLTWSTTNATSVSIDNNVGTVTASGQKTVSPTSTTTYTLTATGAGGTVTRQVTVTVNVSGPGISFTASPDSLAFGGSSTLTWSTTNATSVSIDNGVGNVPTSGNLVVSPARTTIYRLTAIGPGGTSTADAVVVVVPKPTATLTATPSNIPIAGQPVTLNWSTTDATSVVINNGIGAVTFFGLKNINPVATTTYTLTATGVGGTTTASVTITVGGAVPGAKPRSVRH